MKHLLLVAHGSRLEASNAEIRNLASRLGKYSEDFALVSYAFLEIALPSIPEGLRALVNQGATEIVVMPYFLSAGRHVSSDIPEQVAAFKQEAPQVKICIAPYFGANHHIAALLIQQAEAVILK